MDALVKVGWWLVVLSAVNVGLVSLLNLDVISSVLGAVPGATQVWGVLVGVAGVYSLVTALGGKRR